MKNFLLLSLMVLLSLAVQSQAPIPAGFEHWTAADLQTVNKTLAERGATDSHHAASKTISDYPNDLFLLAHREAHGQSELDERQADVFVVESGAATVVVGGAMVSPETTAPHAML